MFARYQISLNAIGSGATATTISIPVTLEFQQVDQTELIETKFVDVEVEKAINPIVDYEQVRFIPLDHLSGHVRNVIYKVDVLSGSSIVSPTTYSHLGFNDEDIRLRRNNFKESFLYLRFFDSDIPLSQNLVTQTTIYTMLLPIDLIPIGGSGMLGQPKPASQIPVSFTLSSPVLNPRGFAEGYHLYDYKTSYAMQLPRYLYMRANYKNSKTGKVINLMTQPTAFSIDQLVKKLYTRYILTRTTTGFYYTIDSTYSTNVSYIPTPTGYDVRVNLYQIQSL